MLPVVLYNGAPRWSAATEVAELIPTVPGLVAQYRPQMKYLVIDEGAFSVGHLASLQNLVATVFRIEHPSTPESIRELIGLLEVWLKDKPELKRMFAIWIRATLMRRSDYTMALPEVENLKELNMALAERMVEWAEGYKAQGMQQGVQEGRRAEALAMLERVLVRRFGEIPESVKLRTQGASADIIETWFDRALDASSLAAVFGDAPPTV
ncbi:hypothetical protein [Rhodoferax sp.]|uniref:hypothetical protein n=1 Tax=Rhodoferax sp. TaxID=50421 RepID=UPI0039B88E71